MDSFDYDINNIMNDINNFKPNNYSKYILEDANQNVYEVNEDFEPINDLL